MVTQAGGLAVTVERGARIKVGHRSRGGVRKELMELDRNGLVSWRWSEMSCGFAGGLGPAWGEAWVREGGLGLV